MSTPGSRDAGEWAQLTFTWLYAHPKKEPRGATSSSPAGSDSEYAAGTVLSENVCWRVATTVKLLAAALVAMKKVSVIEGTAGETRRVYQRKPATRIRV
jgi:predicted anti-sigma-YlaC factor YlaD